MEKKDEEVKPKYVKNNWPIGKDQSFNIEQTTDIHPSKQASVETRCSILEICQYIKHKNI